VFPRNRLYSRRYYKAKASEKEIGSATQEATRIVNNALQEAENAKNPA
jgi:hypothetical protein